MVHVARQVPIAAILPPLQIRIGIRWTRAFTMSARNCVLPHSFDHVPESGEPSSFLHTRSGSVVGLLSEAPALLRFEVNAVRMTDILRIAGGSEGRFSGVP